MKQEEKQRILEEILSAEALRDVIERDGTSDERREARERWTKAAPVEEDDKG